MSHLDVSAACLDLQHAGCAHCACPCHLDRPGVDIVLEEVSC